MTKQANEEQKLSLLAEQIQWIGQEGAKADTQESVCQDSLRNERKNNAINGYYRQKEINLLNLCSTGQEPGFHCSIFQESEEARWRSWTCYMGLEKQVGHEWPKTEKQQHSMN